MKQYKILFNKTLNQTLLIFNIQMDCTICKLWQTTANGEKNHQTILLKKNLLASKIVSKSLSKYQHCLGID
jgi:hypothetical protein